MGITNTGVDSEELLCTHTGANLLPRGDALGDAVLHGEVFIEVKKTTLNQTRPNKYNVLVAHDNVNDDWYVMPPDEIIRMTKGRRGQHTPDPMTCIGLGKVTTKKFAEFKIQNITDLKTKILEAYLQGQNHADLRDYARTHREENEKRLLEVQAKLESII